MAGCLVDILGSLRTNPNTEVQDFWLWASDKRRVQVYADLLTA